MLAARFGLSALPVTLPSGGTNYANGSAQSVSTTQADGYQNDSSTTCLASRRFPITSPLSTICDPGALYMINIGANDLFWMQTQQANLLPQQLYETYMKPFAATLATSVATLQADGARTIVVLDFNEYARLVQANGNSPPPVSSISTSPRHTERRLVLSGGGGRELRTCRHQQPVHLRIAEPGEVRIYRRLRAGVQSSMRKHEQPRVQPRPACRAGRRADPFMGGRSSPDHGGAGH